MNATTAIEPTYRRGALWESAAARTQRRAMWGAMIAGVAIVGAAYVVGNVAIAEALADPPAHVAQRQVADLAHGFARWKAAHADQRCPARIAELGAPLDPWGHAFQYTCDPRLLRVASSGIAITSAGEDGSFGTPDDLGSEP